jgi:hypothetical protein
VKNIDRKKTEVKKRRACMSSMLKENYRVKRRETKIEHCIETAQIIQP